MTNTNPIQLSYDVAPFEAGVRFDQLAAQVFGDYSRSQIKQWILSGELTLDGAKAAPKTRVKSEQCMLLSTQIEDHSTDLPEAMELDIVYEDEHLMVVNKPVGLVVHPGAGNRTGTLVNGLLHHEPALSKLPRAGLVHRIDKDTSGLLVVGKTAPVQLALQEQLKDKTVYRRYLALAVGEVRAQTINAPIGRHPSQRTRMAVVESGKTAVTHVEVLFKNDLFSWCSIKLETGRTHQIRVHMQHIDHPLWCDPVYLPARYNQLLTYRDLPKIDRQVLHAAELGFVHPVSGEALRVHADLPVDIAELLEKLGIEL